MGCIRQVGDHRPPARGEGMGKRSRSRGASSRPSFAHHNAKKRFASKKQGSGAPKGALSNQYPRLARLRAALAARRLSALTLAALATGYYPDGSAPEPGFPRRRLTGVLPASLKNAAVKHAPCGPVLLPVDRGPRAARVRIGNSARGHRTPPSLSRHAVRNGALHKAR
jgi:hypothetical protein